MKPNFVLLMSDQHRWDAMGCSGNRFVSTPHMDRLAEDGARFANAFTPFPVCTPARASMWTGVYPHVHDVTGNVYGISNAIAEVSKQKETVFDILQQEGYDTAYFGKWHLGEDAPDFFDHWRGFNSLGGHWQRSDDGERYKPDIQTDQSIEYLKERAEADEPFILVNGYYPPHDPFSAPERFYEPYRGQGVPFAGYYAAVSAIDECVGRTVQAIDDLGLAENTIVIYFSDHGETFKYREDGEHKFVCHEESIRVPMLVRWPGQIEPGQVLDCKVGLQDLMPTLLDWAGTPLPEYLHGTSMAPWLRGEAPDWRETYYVENITRYNRHHQRCLRDDGWKLILSDGGPNELYDLTKDPEEELNVYAAPYEDRHNQFMHYAPFTDVIETLTGKLAEHARALDDPLGLELADRARAEMSARGDTQRASGRGAAAERE